MEKKDECFHRKPEAASDALNAWPRETLHSIQTDKVPEWCGVNRYLNTVSWHIGEYENMENILKLRK